MAITPIATIKNWFKTGEIPTQEQFWALFDSFRHKREKVPVADVEGINELIMPFNTHANDPNAHASLFARTKILAPGELWVKKANGNTNNNLLEIGDLCEGIVEGLDIKGVWNGGEKHLLSSFILIINDEIPTIEM